MAEPTKLSVKNENRNAPATSPWQPFDGREAGGAFASRAGSCAQPRRPGKAR